jgi:hypothetical protein
MNEGRRSQRPKGAAGSSKRSKVRPNKRAARDAARNGAVDSATTIDSSAASHRRIRVLKRSNHQGSRSSRCLSLEETGAILFFFAGGPLKKKKNRSPSQRRECSLSSPGKPRYKMAFESGSTLIAGLVRQRPAPSCCNGQLAFPTPERNSTRASVGSARFPWNRPSYTSSSRGVCQSSPESNC